MELKQQSLKTFLYGHSVNIPVLYSKKIIDVINLNGLSTNINNKLIGNKIEIEEIQRGVICRNKRINVYKYMHFKKANVIKKSLINNLRK